MAALQLRNPMHRSHEYLCKIAVEVCDGVYIHSLVGNLKPGDIPAEVRVKCIDTLVKNYFVPQNVVQGGYPLDMRYAGPLPVWVTSMACLKHKRFLTKFPPRRNRAKP